MSSATSTDVRLEPGTKPDEVPSKPEDASAFGPAHFFLLMALAAAATAVVLARQANPAHLIVISLTIGAAGLAAAALYRTLAPLAADDASAYAEPLTGRARAALEREKQLVLRSIKELEFDRAMGKLSPKDFDEMSGRLRARALALMTQLDEGGAGYREIIERELAARMASFRVKAEATADGSEATSSLTCAACRTTNDADAAFCKRCGRKLAA